MTGVVRVSGIQTKTQKSPFGQVPNLLMGINAELVEVESGMLASSKNSRFDL